MQILALCFGAAWLYSLVTLIYFPLKIAAMRRRSEDVWVFLSRRRLLLSAAAYLLAAPVLLFLAEAGAVAGVSGGGGGTSGTLDFLIPVGWGCLWVLLAAAAAALIAAFWRPQPTRE